MIRSPAGGGGSREKKKKKKTPLLICIPKDTDTLQQFLHRSLGGEGLFRQIRFLSSQGRAPKKGERGRKCRDVPVRSRVRSRAFFLFFEVAAVGLVFGQNPSFFLGASSFPDKKVKGPLLLEMSPGGRHITAATSKKAAAQKIQGFSFFSQRTG